MDNSKKYSITDFHKDYLEKYNECKDYRIGQFFISLFVKDSSEDFMCKLWNELNQEKAYKMIYEVIEKYNWDCYDLPLLRGRGVLR